MFLVYNCYVDIIWIKIIVVIGFGGKFDGLVYLWVWLIYKVGMYVLW